ncbi:hypothetical protein K439DRAFT_1288447, partial [Ramaria rubella]
FTKFCDDFHIPESLHMPASEPLLCAFISTHGAGTVGEGAIHTWLEGLKLWHCINHAPWHSGPELKCAIEGCATFTPDTSHLPRRDPITFKHIHSLHHHL